MSQPTISDYEKIRLQNIQKNEQYLTDIGVEKTNRAERSKGPPSKRVKKTHVVNEELPTRRSNRVATLPPVSYLEVM
jgi:hypothetical protein